MAFNDGEPLSAEKLGELELKLNNLAASIPRFGDSSTSINVTNNTTNAPQTINIPEISASFDHKWSVIAGKNSQAFSFPSAMNSVPRVVMLTVRRGESSNPVPSVAVVLKTTSQTGFTAECVSTYNGNIYLNILAVAY